MDTLYIKFSRSLRWNTFESIVYQGALLGHQLMLFKASSGLSYGLIGTIFSTIYLTIAIANLGFDSTLGSFFTTCTKTQYSFKKLLIPQIIPELILLTTLPTIVYLNIKSIGVHFPQVLQIETSMYVIVGLIIFCEGLKKTFRTILQLSFLNHKTTFVEILTISLYIGIVWGGYALGYPITLNLIFIPMASIAFLGMALLGYWVWQWYRALPLQEQNVSTHKGVPQRIIKNRSFNYLIHISHLVFSGNFLIPLLAIQFGLDHAGLFKLVSTIIHAITTLINRVFGLSTEALLAHVKEMDMETQRTAFVHITSNLNQVLYGIIIFFIINHAIIFNLHKSAHSETAWLLGSLFIVIQLSEHFFMAYEKFYHIQEKSSHLFLFSIMTMLMVYGVFWYSFSYGPMVTLLGVITIRAFSFACISIASLKTWQLKPSWRPIPEWFVGSLILATMFRFLMH